MSIARSIVVQCLLVVIVLAGCADAEKDSSWSPLCETDAGAGTDAAPGDPDAGSPTPSCGDGACDPETGGLDPRTAAAHPPPASRPADHADARPE